MSFSSRSSRSSNSKHYKKGNNGSNHYQKKGILGKLFNMMGSGSGSDSSNRNSNRNRNGNIYQNTPIVNETVTNQNDLICSKCNSKVPAGSKFCLECGEKVKVTLFCMNCGEGLPANAKFCLKCGKGINS